MTRAEIRAAGRELLVSSLTGRATQMREHEQRCRRAYSASGPLRDAALRLAGVYERAAEVFEGELGQIEFVEGTPPDLDAMNRGRAAVGMPPLSPDDPRLRPPDSDES